MIYLEFIPWPIPTPKALLITSFAAKLFARKIACFTLFNKANFLNSLTTKILFEKDLDIVLLSSIGSVKTSSEPSSPL